MLFIYVKKNKIIDYAALTNKLEIFKIIKAK